MEDHPAEISTAPENPHVLWRQILGFLFWTTGMGLLGGGVVEALFMILIGSTTFADAWNSGIWKNPDKKSFLNISPMSWGIAVGLLFIVAFPAYALYRNRLAQISSGNGYFIATLIFGSFASVMMVLELFGAFSAT